MFGKKKQPLVIDTEQQSSHQDQPTSDSTESHVKIDQQTKQLIKDHSHETHRSLLQKVKQNTLLSVLIIIFMVALVSFAVWYVWDKVATDQKKKDQANAEEASRLIAEAAISGDLTKEEETECRSQGGISEPLEEKCLIDKKMKKIDKVLSEQKDKITDRDKEKMLNEQLYLLEVEMNREKLDQIAEQIDKMQVKYTTYAYLAGIYEQLDVEKSLIYYQKAKEAFENREDDGRPEDWSSEIFDNLINDLKKRVAAKK
ncbi:MAG: hypothetical protein Q3996_00635 [Candidatus Saccharibacteria bacterium]|nr:hypothetical protein [Candidatus Saccharibacteria bacterium]